MFSSNCCFLTCIQISQEAGQVVWYSHLFKNFPQFVVIFTVKGFSDVDEAQVYVFLDFPCFLYDPADVGALISGSSAFSKSSLYIWKFLVHVLLKPRLKDFKHNLTSMWNDSNYTVVWMSYCIDLFSSSVAHCWVFQISWHVECSTLTASSFKIWNSSTEIPSPPLALFVV